MTAAGELAMFLAIGAAAVGLLFGPVGSAVARRILDFAERLLANGGQVNQLRGGA